VALEVVPSLHWVGGAAGAVSSAREGKLQAIASAEAATSEMKDFDFMIYS
jgi:hypothetical protein